MKCKIKKCNKRTQWCDWNICTENNNDRLGNNAEPILNYPEEDEVSDHIWDDPTHGQHLKAEWGNDF